MTLIDKQDDLFINDSRFEIGMKLFNSCQWYKSHDVFEEIWHETGGPERQLIQGILQVAVAQVHLENSNLNGATILYGEALGRLKRFHLANFGFDLLNSPFLFKEFVLLAIPGLLGVPGLFGKLDLP